MSKSIQNVKINGEALYLGIKDYAFANHFTLAEVSESVGRCGTYINNLKNYDHISEPMFNLICKSFGLSPDKYLVKPEPPKPIEKPAEVVTTFYLPPVSNVGYEPTLNVGNDRVFLAVYKDGKMQHHASSFIKKDAQTREFGIFQAISYAAHMMYKSAEQAVLEGK